MCCLTASWSDAALMLKLQGNGVTLVQCKAVILSLTSRLHLYRQGIGRRQFAHFPQLIRVIYFSEASLNKYIIIGLLYEYIML